MRNCHYDAKEINWQLDVIRENIFQKPRIQTSGADVLSHFRLDAAKLRECALAQADEIAEGDRAASHPSGWHSSLDRARLA